MAKKIDKQKLKQHLSEHGLALTKQGYVRINFTPTGDVGKIEILTTE